MATERGLLGYSLQVRNNSWCVFMTRVQHPTPIPQPQEYIRVRMQDPVLCLTVSATLRDKPMGLTPQREELIELFRSSGGVYQVVKAKAKANVPPKDDQEVAEDVIYGLEEVNLLEGLTDGMLSIAAGYGRHVEN